MNVHCKNIPICTDILWRVFYYINYGTGSVFVFIRKSTE